MTASNLIEMEAFVERQRAILAKGCTPCLALPNDRDEAHVRAERAAKRTTSEVIADCVAELGPPPVMVQPLPIVGTNTYAPEPCSNPRKSYRAGHTPSCFCGWPMGSHKTAEVIDHPILAELEIAAAWCRL